MATVGIVDIGTTLERHTIVASAIKVRGGVEVVNLFLTDTCNGIVVHLSKHVGILLATTNAC